MRSGEPQDQGSRAALLDYAIIGRYWSKARPSIMGPYMMNGFGFPASAGSYRFDAERKVVDRNRSLFHFVFSTRSRLLCVQMQSK